MHLFVLAKFKEAMIYGKMELIPISCEHQGRPAHKHHPPRLYSSVKEVGCTEFDRLSTSTQRSL